MCEFTEKDAIDLARNALEKNMSEQQNVIKATSDEFQDTGIVCYATIANNKHLPISSEDYFKDYNIVFNYYKKSKSLFEAHSDNSHPDNPHVHIGVDRTSFPLNRKLLTSTLASTTDMIISAHKEWQKEIKDD